MIFSRCPSDLSLKLDLDQQEKRRKKKTMKKSRSHLCDDGPLASLDVVQVCLLSPLPDFPQPRLHPPLQDHQALRKDVPEGGLGMTVTAMVMVDTSPTRGPAPPSSGQASLRTMSPAQRPEANLCERASRRSNPRLKRCDSLWGY